MRFQVIMFKTLKDLFSVRRSVLFLIAVIMVPLIGPMMFASGAPGGVSIASMTLAMQNQMIVGLFIILAFMWIAGIPLVLLAGVTCGDFISKEEQDGTLLLLTSKPVRRYEIIIGKFLAFMLSSVLLEMIALLIFPLLIYVAMSTDIYIFENMLSLVPSMFFYSVFVAFIFGALATTLSSFFKSRIKTIMTLVAIVILVFFGFMVIRNWTEASGIYESYGFNYVDLNYYLGNSYLFFIQSSEFRIMPVYQGIMGTFTGTYDAADVGKLFDRDLGAFPPSLEQKGYTTPAISVFIWLSLAIILLLFGIIRFEKKEIGI